MSSGPQARRNRCSLRHLRRTLTLDTYAAVHNKKIFGKGPPALPMADVEYRRSLTQSRGTGASSVECLRFRSRLHGARPQTVRSPPRAATRSGTATPQRGLGRFSPQALPQSTGLQEPPLAQAPPVSLLAWLPSWVSWPSSWRASQLSFWRPSGPPFSSQPSSWPSWLTI